MTVPHPSSTAPDLPLVDLAAVHEELGDELEAAMLEVCRSQQFIGGEHVEGFELEFAAYLGVGRVVGVANGTDAITLVMRALGIGDGDEVLVPANTFIATAEAVVAAGAVPRLVDVDPASGLIDLNSCESAVGPATAAIVPVHLYGRMAEMDPVMRFAREHGLRVIEDAAQAHGARRDGAFAGTIGDAGTFSFYPGKNLGALGDAGAIATRDEELAERLVSMRNHGRSDHTHLLGGVNSRLDAIQAAALRVKLPHLDRWTQARAAVAAGYRKRLEDGLLDWRADDPASEVHHLFPIFHDRRDQLADHLRTAGISTGVHYREALTTVPAFRRPRETCAVAEHRASRQLSLPIHPHLGEPDLDRIVEAVRAFHPV